MDRESIVEYLHRVLANEVTAATQYFSHARIYKRFGLYRLYARAHQESIDEMRHADKLIERILALDGTPNPNDLQRLQDLKTILLAEQMLRRDHELERDCMTLIAEAIAYCGRRGDRASCELLHDILGDEQEHADWLAAELDRMGRSDPRDYI